MNSTTHWKVRDDCLMTYLIRRLLHSVPIPVLGNNVTSLLSGISGIVGGGGGRKSNGSKNRVERYL